MSAPGSQSVNPSELLHLSWREPNFVPNLNPNNVLDYFSDKSNPFYDRRCNNEHLKMQHAGLERLADMEGIEYALIHFQDPILYVIQKRERRICKQSGTSTISPLSHYHIIGGTVYQAPDLASVLNSRLATSLDKILNAFTDCQSASNFHPNKGYWWDWPGHKVNKKGKEEEEKNIQKIATKFQKNRVDILLSKLQRNHPHIFFQTHHSREPIKLNVAETKTDDKPRAINNRKSKIENDIGPIAKRPRTQ